MPPFVSAIVLAAGRSCRMGQSKLLLPIGATTILERTVDNFLESIVSEVIVVLGPKPERIARVISRRPIKVAVNPDYRKGMSTTIKVGLNTIDARAQGIMLALADQPFVDGKTINRLLESFGAGERDIIVPVYQGKRGHPVIFSLVYRPELKSLVGDMGGRKIIMHHPEKVLEVPVDYEGVIIDIDTPKAYHLAKQRLYCEGDS